MEACAEVLETDLGKLKTSHRELVHSLQADLLLYIEVLCTSIGSKIIKICSDLAKVPDRDLAKRSLIRSLYGDRAKRPL